MTKQSIADASSQVFRILEGFERDDRLRIMRAALTLFGYGSVQTSDDTQDVMPAQESETGQGTKPSEQDFFNRKQPSTKIEELAVAARFRELYHKLTTHEKSDLQATTSKARRNFDVKHFKRDIQNAKTAGLFNKGADNTLAYYGQNYVDALPDREKVRQLPRPKGSARRKKKRSKPE